MRRSLLVVVLLLVIAGCNTPTDEPSSPTSLTPAPVPDTESAGLAPGVTEAGPVDPNALQNAHVARLDGGDFTLRRVRVERTTNGTLRSRTRLVARSPGNGRYHIERTFTGPVHDRVGTGGRLL